MESLSMYTSADWQIPSSNENWGEEAIVVLPHAAIVHGVDPSAIVGMDNVLSSQKEMHGHEVPA